MTTKRRTDGHCIQYALVGHDMTLVLDTDKLSDEQVRKEAQRLAMMSFCELDRVDRYNRCLECEVWTMDGKRLRRNLKCPAIKERVAQLKKSHDTHHS